MSELLFPLQFKRQYAGPLDSDLVFGATSALNAYTSNALRFAGQLATCTEQEGKIFILNNATNAWISYSSAGPALNPGFVGFGNSSSAINGTSALTFDGSNLAVSGYISEGTSSLSTKYEYKVAPGTSAQFYRGDKTWQTLNASNISGVSAWTGFNDYSLVTTNYSSAARTITLSGTAKLYYNGVMILNLSSGNHVSSAHSSAYNKYFYYYNGTSFVWDTVPWTFDNAQISQVNYSSGYSFALNETHSLMSWRDHQEFHETIGTYRNSGAILGSIINNSTTPANRRPSVTSAILSDEDLKTNLSALSTGTYTRMYIGSGGVASLTTGSSDIVSLSGNIPQWNNVSTGALTNLTSNDYMNVWLLAIPVTSDAQSQQFRYVFLNGQTAGTSAQLSIESTNNLSLGDFTSLSPEYIFCSKILIRYVASNWVIISVTNLSGTRIGQIGTAVGTSNSIPIPVPVSYGGTSKTTLTPFSLLYSFDATTFGEVSPNSSTSPMFLKMTGNGTSGQNPLWQPVGVSDISSTGTPSSTTYLRGDGTWATPVGIGTIGGSIANNQIAIGSGVNAIAGTSALTWDGSTLALAVGTAITMGNVNLVRMSLNSGHYSFAMGYNANALNSIGGIAIGSYALDGTSTPGNVAIGYLSSRVITSGGDNVAIGTRTLELAGNTNGTIAIGSYALCQLYSGQYHSAIGNESLTSLTTASENTAIGARTGLNTTIGSYNVFIGNDAGLSNVAGSYNLFAGYKAGYLYAYSSAASSITANVFLGPFTGYSNSSGVGNIFIGYGAGYSELTSNKLYISNSTTTTPLIWGDFSTVRVGIGRQATTYTLESSGDIFSTGYLRGASALFTSAESTVYTSSASLVLPSGATIGIYNSNVTSSIYAGTYCIVRNAANTAQCGYYGVYATSAGYAPIHVWGSRNGYTSYTEYMRLDEGGKFGIGIIPTSDFHVEKTQNGYVQVSIRSNPATATDGDVTRLQLGTKLSATSLVLDAYTSVMTANGFVQPSGTTIAGNNSGGLSIVAGHTNGALRFYAGGNNERMSITAAGQIHVGTSVTYAVLIPNNTTYTTNVSTSITGDINLIVVTGTSVVTLTLPATDANGTNVGQQLMIKSLQTGAGSCTVQRVGSNVYYPSGNGASQTSFTVSQSANIKLVSNGLNGANGYWLGM